MQNNGLVSIIMPSYNSEKYIKDSIESVLKQTYDNWELIIVDDCSKDNTVEVINNFNDNRIRLFINDHNCGAALSRNKALRAAQGKWIAFLDSDDLWLPKKLEKQIAFMLTNNYHFSYTDYRIYKKKEWEKVIRTSPNILNYRIIKKYCYCFTSTVMYNREAIGLIQIGDLKKNNDYAMWLKALKNNNGYRFPFCFTFYIKHDDSISSVSKIKLIKWHYVLFKNECGFNSLHSLILTIRNVWFGVWKKIRFKKSIKRYYSNCTDFN